MCIPDMRKFAEVRKFVEKQHPGESIVVTYIQCSWGPIIDEALEWEYHHTISAGENFFDF